MRKMILARPRFFVSSTIFLSLCAASVVPFATSVEVPTIIEAKGFEKIYPVAPAQVVKVRARNGQTVAEGQILVQLISPQLENELTLERINLQKVEQQIARRTADRKDREQGLVLQRQRLLIHNKIAGLERRIAKLEVRAPFGGRVVDLNPDLHDGRWIGPNAPLLTVVDDTDYVARGYLAEADLWRIANGTSGKFVPDDVMRKSVPVSVRDVSVANTPALEIAYLASIHEGPVAVRKDAGQQLIPVEAQYLVLMDLLDPQPPGRQVTRGLVRLDGRPESIAARVWRRTLQVLVRESGA